MEKEKSTLGGLLSRFGIVGAIPYLSISECDEKANNVIRLINENGLAQVERKIGKSIRTGETVVINERVVTASYALVFDELMSESEYKGIWAYCKKYNDGRYHKRKRALKRIKCMFRESEKLNIPIYFVTFTFNDKTLLNRNTESRRQAVQRTLKASGALDYYANIDYGEKNGREHYHAVVLGNCYFYKDGKTNRVAAGSNKSFIDYSSKFGNIKSEKVNFCSNSDKRLAKYINKFSNHAAKDTTNFKVRCISKIGVEYPEEYYKTADQISIDHYHNYLKHQKKMQRYRKNWPDYDN